MKQEQENKNDGSCYVCSLYDPVTKPFLSQYPSFPRKTNDSTTKKMLTGSLADADEVGGGGSRENGMLSDDQLSNL